MKLTQEQYQRVLQSEGLGQSHKFNPKTYVQSLSRIKGLDKMRKRCPKYVLYSDQLGRRAYVADWRIAKLTETESPLTFDKSEALVFYEGFDDVNMKKSYYEPLTKLKLSWHYI
jgi:hypothetical protein